MLRTDQFTISSSQVELLKRGRAYGVGLSFVSGDAEGFPVILLVTYVDGNQQEPILARDGVYYVFDGPARSILAVSATGKQVTFLADVGFDPKDFVNLTDASIARNYQAVLIATATNAAPFADVTYRTITKPRWANKLSISAYITGPLAAMTAAITFNIKHGNPPAGINTDLTFTALGTMSNPFTARMQNVATFGIQGAAVAESPGDGIKSPGSQWHDPMPPPDVLGLQLISGTPAAGQAVDILARWAR